MILFTEGFMLGLSTGVFCMSACLPIFFPYLLSEGNNSWKTNFFILLQFLAGRFFAYLIFALLTSWFAKSYASYLPQWVLPCTMIVSSLLMLSYLFFSNQFLTGICGISKQVKISSAVPFVLGFLTGINPCPPFITGFVRLLQIANVLKGIFYFTGFFVSTSLFILPAILPTPWINARLKNIGRIALFIASLWYLLMGISRLIWVL